MIPRPTYKEGYAVKTSIRPPAHYDLPNRRRNLLVRPSQKKSNNYKAYSIREEIKHVVNRYSKVEEYPNPSTVKKSPVAPAQKFSSIKPCPNKWSKDLPESRDKKEAEYLFPYAQVNASKKKYCPPQVYNQKIPSMKPRLKRPKEPKTINSGYCYQDEKEVEENTEAFKYYQQSAEIGHAEKTYNHGPCCNKIEKDKLGEPNSKADINPEDIKALKVIEKVAEMDHMDKIFESKDVKVLDEEYYMEKAPDDELLGILWKNYSSPTICFNNMEEIQTKEINPKEEPLEPKLEPSLAGVPDKSDCEMLVEDNSNQEKNINRAKRPLEGEALHLACAEWMKKLLPK
ncbi:hypothetical protein F8M41_010998 [Gigaspora margarita]|uniref:Uncharacterized protein n=1 Tax=Gigaspora margarita TaxID=4874 RepID=A0A8H3X302_GIGMA|nr:hypothetical protein F8M41_010998 [Gigaspora margarita]